VVPELYVAILICRSTINILTFPALPGYSQGGTCPIQACIDWNNCVKVVDLVKGASKVNKGETFSLAFTSGVDTAQAFQGWAFRLLDAMHSMHSLMDLVW
jgi:hypothetical protein